MRDIKFDVMFKDEKVASIAVKDNTVHALTYTDIRYKQPFNKIVSLEYIERFLEDRCIPRNRQNINELLVLRYLIDNPCAMPDLSITDFANLTSQKIYKRYEKIFLSCTK